MASGAEASSTEAPLPELGSRVAKLLTKDEGGWNQQDTAGTVTFIGKTEFAEGTWIGIRLDKKEGKNDGSVQDKRYFECEPGHGIFVRPHLLTLESQLSSGQAPAPIPAQLEDATSSIQPPRRDDAVVTSTSSRRESGQSMNTVRRQLVEASENHDAAQIGALLARAERMGVTPSEIESARKIMQYELEVAMERRRKSRPTSGHRSSTLEMDVPIVVAGREGESAAGDRPVASTATEVEDILAQFAHLRNKQDDWLRELDVRITGLEAGSTSGSNSGSNRGGAPPEADRRLARLEGHLQELWGAVCGEALPLRPGAPQEDRLAQLEGQVASLRGAVFGEQALAVAVAQPPAAQASGGTAAGSPSKARGPATEHVMSLEELERAFATQDPQGEGSVATASLPAIFQQLGFQVRSAAELSAVMDPRQAGKVSFGEFAAAFQKS